MADGEAPRLGNQNYEATRCSSVTVLFDAIRTGQAKRVISAIVVYQRSKLNEIPLKSVAKQSQGLILKRKTVYCIISSLVWFRLLQAFQSILNNQALDDPNIELKYKREEVI